jgi:hypothetical protein
MTKKDIIQNLKDCFLIQELVCPHTYAAFGEKSWQFLDRDLLQTIWIVRKDIVKVPMFINNWHYWKSSAAHGSLFDERGFRCNICDLCKQKTINGVLYLSAHANGAGIDFDAQGLTVAEVHELIRTKAYLLPVRVRMEEGVNWNHLDIYDDPLTTDQFTTFNA